MEMSEDVSLCMMTLLFKAICASVHYMKYGMIQIVFRIIVSFQRRIYQGLAKHATSGLSVQVDVVRIIISHIKNYTNQIIVQGFIIT